MAGGSVAHRGGPTLKITLFFGSAKQKIETG